MSIAALMRSSGKAALLPLLADTCRIRPNVPTIGASGPAQSWPAVASSVRCLVTAPSIGQTGDVDQSMLPIDKRVYVPLGTAIAQPYRIDWVDGGITLEVVRTVQPPGTTDVVLAVDCVEVPS